MSVFIKFSKIFGHCIFSVPIGFAVHGNWLRQVLVRQKFEGELNFDEFERSEINKML